MTDNNTLVRSLHDLGAAGWFGGSLAGVLGINGGAAAASDPRERLRLSGAGWSKWGPAQYLAIGSYVVGSAGMLLSDKGRLAAQPEARTNALIKLGLTVVAAGATVWSSALGRSMSKRSAEGTAGVTEPSGGSSDELKSAQGLQKVVQWVTPLATAGIIVLAAQQGEQQRPSNWLSKIKDRF